MKKIFNSFMLILLTISLFAQAPQKMSYQAVIRNTRGGLYKETNNDEKVKYGKNTLIDSGENQAFK